MIITRIYKCEKEVYTFVANYRGYYPSKPVFTDEDTEDIKTEKNKKYEEDLKLALEKAENNYDLETAAKLRHGTIPRLEKELAELEKINKSDILSDTVDEESVAAIISKWTNIPISKLVGGEREKLLHLEENMKKRVKGQDNAIHLVKQILDPGEEGEPTEITLPGLYVKDYESKITEINTSIENI